MYNKYPWATEEDYEVLWISSSMMLIYYCTVMHCTIHATSVVEKDATSVVEKDSHVIKSWPNMKGLNYLKHTFVSFSILHALYMYHMIKINILNVK